MGLLNHSKSGIPRATTRVLIQYSPFDKLDKYLSSN